MLDNSGKNRSKGIFKLASTKKAHLFFTVPTSPEMNLIELVFGNLKKDVKKAMI